MSLSILALILVVVLFLMLFIGVPVVFSMGIASLIVLVMKGGIPLTIIPQKLVTGTESFTLLAIPFFLFAGLLMDTAGIGSRIFGFARAIVGSIRGGLGHVNVLASMLFAGMSGTATADAAGLGSIEIPAMKEAGFDNPFACAVTAASSTIGPIVPPSVPMVIYGVIAEVSIARLFVAGLIPGIIMGVAVMLFIYFIARKRNYPVDRRSTLRETANRFGKSWMALLTPIIIMGGIMTGVFSPTEAGVIASFYTLLVALFIYKEFHLIDIPRLLTRVAKETAIILIITAAATILGWLLSVLQVPRQVANLLGSTINRPILLLLLINLIYLFVGCFINTIPAIAMTVPVFLPIVKMAGVNPIHFGVIVVLNLCIGMITPPVGSVLFVTARVGQISLTSLVRELLPFYLTLITVLVLITIFPPLTLWLPSVVF